ncbi:MAG: glycyl-radical enzyme activating protein, partial [Clostridia bacterium]|nr:glycyl-radical enzyme activating protein [Clostridia bacterium]
CVCCGECVKNCPTSALEICGKNMPIEAILSEVEKDQAFYGKSGGITLSGGEPFAQGEAVIELLKACKECGLSTAVDTCGYADSDIILAALPYIDLFLWDIKDTDDERHVKYTGASVGPILKNLSSANEAGARIRLRCILIAGVNTDEEHYSLVAEIARRIDNLDGIDIIPYHAYAGSKATFLGRPDNGRPDWIPSDDEVARANEMIRGEIK